jgi:shikimate dehydrogenase
MHQAALDHLHIDARYEAWAVPPDGLADRVRELRLPDVVGANVTVPHKEAVISLLDTLDSRARRVGAVNTIVCEGGGLVGYNTDSHGFLRGLSTASFDLKGKHALVLGAGGAARSVVLALVERSVSSVVIANRNMERALKLAEEVECEVKIRVVALEEGVVGKEALRSDLIVNCTSLGMRGSPGEGVTPLSARYISRAAVVYDLVYNPLETPLLREAKMAGARIIGGLTMLVHQGAAAFKLWMGCEAPIEVMMQAASAALQKR